MNKKQIIEAVVESTDLPMKDAEKAVSATISAIADGICNKENVFVSGLGTFSIVHRAARVGKNFHTGKFVKIPACYRVKFSTSSQLLEKLK